jgi:DNA-directed RNA polymerase subunit K/omega
MSRLRRQIGNSIANNLETKDVSKIKAKTGNVYESITVISKRANQINVMLKEELHNKLEIHENKEQIEISKAYERMPNPSLLATQEFLDDKVYFKRNEDDNLFR